MENIYADLKLPINKLKVYAAWKQEGGKASPPIGAYTAVRLRIPVTEFIQTQYFILSKKTFSISSVATTPSTVNLAIFHNGKILFSGVNRHAIILATSKLCEFLDRRPDVFYDELDSFR